MKHRIIARQGRLVTVAACCLLMGAWTMQSCKDEYTLTGQPSWLGNSIYERLQQEGNYTTLLQLVDDLEQTEVLSHTGSKTLFAANDSAFKAWFSNNTKEDAAQQHDDQQCLPHRVAFKRQWYATIGRYVYAPRDGYEYL